MNEDANVIDQVMRGGNLTHNEHFGEKKRKP